MDSSLMAGLQRRLLLAALCMLMTLPLWWPGVPPLADLPGHLGRYRIMTAGNAPMLTHSFAFHWQLLGNLAADVSMVPLIALLGVEPATKLLVILTVVVTAIGMVWLAWEVHGRVPVTILFVLPLIYNWPFHYGFINYSLTLGAALAALALWIRLGRLGRLRLRASVFVAISVLLWLGHSAAWGVFGLAAFGSDLARRRGADESWGRAVPGAALACVPLAVPLLLMLAAPATTSVVETTPLAAGRNAWAMGKLTWALSLLRDRFKYFDYAGVLLLAGLGLFALLSRRLRLAPLLLWPGLILAVAAIAMPSKVLASDFADMRLFPAAAILLLLAIDVKPGEARLATWLGWLGAAFLIVRLAGNTASLAMGDARYRSELAALSVIPRDTSVLVLVASGCDTPWSLGRDEHLGGFAIARRDAFTNDQFAEPGKQLILVRRTDVLPFRADRSQLVRPASCAGPLDTQFDRAIAGFNRAAFPYVWTIGIPLGTPVARDLVPIWSNDRSAVYRVVAPAG